MSLHHPSIVLILVPIMGLAAALTLIAVGALWSRVRALPIAENTRRIDDLARRQETIESLVGRLEAGATPAGKPVAGRGPDVAPTPHAPPTPTPARPSAAGPSIRPRPVLRADRGGDVAVGGPTLIAVPSLAAGDSDASEAAAELGRRFGAIWSRADGGQPPESIARATGLPIGQVELILGLRRQLLQAGQPGSPPPR
jgi:hypothetical protein